MFSEGKNDLEPSPQNPTANLEEKQKARCLLREKFLRTITGVIGKECTFHMYSNTNVEGVFRGSDIEFENLLVERLKTPLGELPSAKIRSPDVNYLEFKNFTKS